MGDRDTDTKGYRLLILGGTGMLGHKVLQEFQGQSGGEVFGTIREARVPSSLHAILDANRVLGSVSAEDFDSVVRAIAYVRPTVVVNCIGIVKQRHEARESIASLTVNALFPHRLAHLCQLIGARLIHVSTDCVFSGRDGHYTETDVSDAHDLYGRTKFLGEVTGPGSLTIRTSIIGRELAGTHGLVEWFLANRGGTVSGYTRAIFSGITTQTLADVLRRLIVHHPEMDGLWHVAAPPIDKASLLALVRTAFGVEITINPEPQPVIDRSLDGARFREATGWVSPPWDAMIERMAVDSTPYEAIRREYAHR